MKYIIPKIEIIEIDYTLLRASSWDNEEGSGDDSDRGTIDESDSDYFEAG